MNTADVTDLTSTHRSVQLGPNRRRLLGLRFLGWLLPLGLGGAMVLAEINYPERVHPGWAPAGAALMLVGLAVILLTLCEWLVADDTGLHWRGMLTRRSVTWDEVCELGASTETFMVQGRVRIQPALRLVVRNGAGTKTVRVPCTSMVPAKRLQAFVDGATSLRAQHPALAPLAPAAGYPRSDARMKRMSPFLGEVPALVVEGTTRLPTGLPTLATFTLPLLVALSGAGVAVALAVGIGTALLLALVQRRRAFVFTNEAVHLVQLSVLRRRPRQILYTWARGTRLWSEGVYFPNLSIENHSIWISQAERSSLITSSIVAGSPAGDIRFP